MDKTIRVKNAGAQTIKASNQQTVKTNNTVKTGKDLRSK